MTITSDYGSIGSFHWMNTNQDFQIEVTHDVTDEVILTVPAWWGCCWWENNEPKPYLNMVATVLAMLLTEGNGQED